MPWHNETIDRKAFHLGDNARYGKYFTVKERLLVLGANSAVCEIVKWMLPEDEKQTQLTEQKNIVFEYDIIMLFETKLMTSTFGNKMLVPFFEVTPPMIHFLNRNIILVPFFALTLLNKHQSFEGAKKSEV